MLDCRQAPTVARVEQETSLGSEGVRTEVALGAPGRFAAFDALGTLAVWTANGNARHGPFFGDVLPEWWRKNAFRLSVVMPCATAAVHYLYV